VGSIKSKLRSGAMLIALNGLAGIAFTALALTPFRIVGFVLAALVLAGIAWKVRSDLTSTIAAQMLVAAGLLAEYRRAVPHATLPLALSGVFVALLIVNMPVLASVVNKPTMDAANLPGYRAERGVRKQASQLYLAVVGLIGLTGVFAAAKLSPWTIVIVGVALTGAAGLVGYQAMRARLHGSQTKKVLRTALEKHNPAFALYFSAPDNTEYHVDMWRPYLERIGKPWVIITRERSPFKVLRASAGPSVPVLYCPTIEHVDTAVTPGLKAVFYVNNGMKNTHIVRFTHLTHIHLGHGDSEKPAGYNPITAMYDRIFVPGQAAIDRYEKHGVMVGRQKFDIVGRPQAESVEVSTGPVGAVASKVVLYASTWKSHFADGDYCSLPIGAAIVRGLIERNATVILRPHPYANRNPESARQLAQIEAILAEDRSSNGRQHLFGKAAAKHLSLVDCINKADALISDVSGTVSEALYSNKPLAMTNMSRLSTAEFQESFPLAQAAYVIDRDAGNLGDIVDALLGADPLEEIRRKVKTYYLGDFDHAHYADGFIVKARSFTE
jgi:hypothetical protein